MPKEVAKEAANLHAFYISNVDLENARFREGAKKNNIDAPEAGFYSLQNANELHDRVKAYYAEEDKGESFASFIYEMVEMQPLLELRKANRANLSPDDFRLFTLEDGREVLADCVDGNRCNAGGQGTKSKVAKVTIR